MPARRTIEDIGFILSQELPGKGGASEVAISGSRMNGKLVSGLFVEGSAYAVLVWLEPAATQQEDRQWLQSNVKSLVAY